MKRDSLFGRLNCRRKYPGGVKAVEPLVLWAWSRYPETFVHDGLLYIRVLERALDLCRDLRSKHVFRDLAVLMVRHSLPTMGQVAAAVSSIKARGMTPEEWSEYCRDEDAGKPQLGPEEFFVRKSRIQRLRRGRTLAG